MTSDSQLTALMQILTWIKHSSKCQETVMTHINPLPSQNLSSYRVRQAAHINTYYDKYFFTIIKTNTVK